MKGGGYRRYGIEDSIFDDGESPLKESSNIELVNSSFKWKYPLWYCNNVNVKDCYFFEMGRAGKPCNDLSKNHLHV